MTRPTIWGNPFTVEKFGDNAIPLFREMVEGYWRPEWFGILGEHLAAEAYKLRKVWLKRIAGNPWELCRTDLKGHDLACFCALDQPCHADVLLEIANGK